MSHSFHPLIRGKSILTSAGLMGQDKEKFIGQVYKKGRKMRPRTSYWPTIGGIKGRQFEYVAAKMELAPAEPPDVLFLDPRMVIRKEIRDKDGFFKKEVQLFNGVSQHAAPLGVRVYVAPGTKRPQFGRNRNRNQIP